MYINATSNKQIACPIKIQGIKKRIDLRALLDSGASDLFMNKKITNHWNLKPQRLKKAISLTNVDDSPNAIGKITQYVDATMNLNGHQTRERFYVADLGQDDIIIGIKWLKEHNPEINWITEELRFSRCKHSPEKTANIQALRLGVELTEEDDDSEEEEDLTPEEQPEEGEDVYEVFDEDLCIKIAVAERLLIEEGDPEREEKTFEELIPKEFHKFRDIFSEEGYKKLPERREYDHEINLQPGSKLPYSKLYPMAPREKNALKEFIDENLASGRIRKSKSPTVAPVFFIPKKNKDVRLVIDYRKLNAITIKDRYPLPMTQRLFDRLAGAQEYSTLDLKWGYHNIRIKEGDEHKAAFVTEYGTYEPVVMQFGLCNAPATFQRMMNELFKDMIDDFVVIYLDDILIYSKNREEHIQHVRKVLQRLRENNLFCRPKKCFFFKKEIEYLGHIISPGKVAMDPKKVAAVQEWPAPQKKKQLQAFLRFANFYRRLVGRFSETARPMTQLLRKDQKWDWGPKQQEAFDKLKRSFVEAPVLRMPDLQKPFVVECDASDFAMGAVLSQKQDDGKTHPVAYFSKGFNQAERNYKIYDKELAVIVYALKQWRHYLEGAEHPVTVISDHQNLLYFQDVQNLTRRQAWWSLFLERFDLHLVHRPGRLGGKPDALSRRHDFEPTEPDNQGQVLLKPELFKIKALRKGHTMMLQEAPILKEIRKATDLDEVVQDALQQGVGPRRLKKGLEDWNTENGLILYMGKVYVPRDQDLRRRIVKAHHDSPEAGHPGEFRTRELVTRNYWWPGMTRFIKNYVAACDTCNRKKKIPGKREKPLQPIEPAKQPWQKVTNDFIVGLPESKGYNAIWVIADHLTRQAHFIPTTTEIDTEETIDLYMNNVWKLHGIPT
jgi:hypothetical protein